MPEKTLQEKMKEAVEAYISNFNAQNHDAIAALYSQDATVEDPIGTPLKEGRSDVHAFYEGAVKSGAKLKLVSPIRLAQKEAAFAFQVTVAATNTTLDVIDTFKFNAAGEVVQMRAYWSEANITRD